MKVAYITPSLVKNTGGIEYSNVIIEVIKEKCDIEILALDEERVRKNYSLFSRSINKIILFLKTLNLAIFGGFDIIFFQGVQVDLITYFFSRLTATDVVLIRQDTLLTCPSRLRKRLHENESCTINNSLPCIHSKSNGWCGTRVNWPTFIYRLFARWADGIIIRGSKLVIFNSYWTKTCHKDTNSFAVIYPFINTAQRNSSRVVGKRVIFVGRLEEEKGANYLRDIFNILPSDWQLVVVGSGSLSAKFESFSRMNPRFRYFRFLSPRNRDRVLKVCSIFVMPSIWDEPYGMAGAEAQQLGLKVVAFNSGGIREWYDDSIIPLVPAGDIEKFKLELLNSIKTSQTLGTSDFPLCSLKEFKRSVSIVLSSLLESKARGL